MPTGKNVQDGVVHCVPCVQTLSRQTEGLGDVSCHGQLFYVAYYVPMNGNRLCGFRRWHIEGQSSRGGRRPQILEAAEAEDKEARRHVFCALRQHTLRQVPFVKWKKSKLV